MTVKFLAQTQVAVADFLLIHAGACCVSVVDTRGLHKRELLLELQQLL